MPQSIKQRGANAIIPPDRNAVVHTTDDMAITERNHYILEIAGLGGEEGRKLWKKLRGYHRRSNGETAMFRFKKFFGESLSCRSWKNQVAEVNVKSLVMNVLTRTGMPLGRWAT